MKRYNIHISPLISPYKSLINKEEHPNGEWVKYEDILTEMGVLTMPKIKDKDLAKFLEDNGITRGSKNWRDYSKAKHLFTSGGFIDCNLYDSLITFTLDYLGL